MHEKNTPTDMTDWELGLTALEIADTVEELEMKNRVLVLGNGIIGRQVKTAATQLQYAVATADPSGATYPY